MTSRLDIPELERPAFFDGQRLEADDLGAIYRHHRDQRWLHNRTLHQWGIVSGFAVTGSPGGRDVAVAPGVALDCQGRELVSYEPATLQIPAVSGSSSGGAVVYYLTATYIDDLEAEVVVRRPGACGVAGAVRRAERPAIEWRKPAAAAPDAPRVRRGLDIVLAAIEVQDCRLVSAPEAGLRRYARPAGQPFIASGRTVAGATEWEFFPDAAAALGVRTLVDTSSARFGATPVYTVQLLGERRLPVSGELVDGFLEVVDPTPTQFEARVVLPRNLLVGTSQLNPAGIFTPATLETLATTLQWHVGWMGVEG